MDYFSAVRTKKAIESVDVVFLVLDAREGVTKQDKIMADHILSEGRALSILVNKWDLALESFRKDPLPGYEDEKDFRKNRSKVLEVYYSCSRFMVLILSFKKEDGPINQEGYLINQIYSCIFLLMKLLNL